MSQIKMMGMSRTLKSILEEISDLDFSNPLAFEMAKERLGDANAIVDFVIERNEHLRQKKSIQVIDNALFKLDQMGRVLE